MGIAVQAPVAHKTGECCPAQHLAGTTEKTAPRLKGCPLLLEIRGYGHVHDIGAGFAIGAKRMLLHRFSYLVTVSSRLSISLATMVQAASSGSGIDGLNVDSPTPS